MQGIEHPELLPEYGKMVRGEVRASWDNFLYFAARLYFAANPHEREERAREEEERGIWSLPSEGALDVGIQIIEIAKLHPDDIDPRLREAGDLRVGGSDAVIININYPLGMAANHILTQVALNTAALKGVYVLGKAATLNGRIGDVMLSTTVFDEHTGNTYWLDNCFRYEHLAPFLIYGSALDNQKALTTRGTFLQNQAYLDLLLSGELHRRGDGGGAVPQRALRGYLPDALPEQRERQLLAGAGGFRPDPLRLRHAVLAGLHPRRARHVLLRPG